MVMLVVPLFEELPLVALPPLVLSVDVADPVEAFCNVSVVKQRILLFWTSTLADCDELILLSELAPVVVIDPSPALRSPTVKPPAQGLVELLVVAPKVVPLVLVEEPLVALPPSVSFLVLAFPVVDCWPVVVLTLLKFILLLTQVVDVLLVTVLCELLPVPLMVELAKAIPLVSVNAATIVPHDNISFLIIFPPLWPPKGLIIARK